MTGALMPIGSLQRNEIDRLRSLIAEAWNSVREQFGIEMELEVELVGDWNFE